MIGESATWRNWHLYGYGRDTTPEMDKLAANGELVVFRDVVSVGCLTSAEVRRLVTDCPFEREWQSRYSLAHILAKAGIDCSIASAQPVGAWSKTDVLYALFNGCSKREYSKIDIGVGAANFCGHDHKMLPVLEEWLSGKASGGRVFFVHLCGSHFPCESEYLNTIHSAEWDEDTVDDATRNLSEKARRLVNRYDRAIHYEDMVLGRIVELLKQNSRPSLMLYISDHGESPQRGHWRDYSAAECYEVPFICWLSEAFRELRPELAERLEAAKDKPIQPDEMFGGFLEILDVHLADPAKQPPSFLDPTFKGRFPRLIRNGAVQYPGDIPAKRQ
ncbi:MAG: phosphoethanolamine transferase [Kiritimatiellae bacterium]|nr:phosphoethanolamine transferase [Kiritimatiellia bacterium]